MNRLFSILLVSALVAMASGYVAVNVEGKHSKEYLKGAVGRVIGDAANLVDGIPWAERIDLEVQKDKKSYLVYDKDYEEKKAKAYEEYLAKVAKYGQQSKQAQEYWEKYQEAGVKYKDKLDGYRHAQLTGTITGDGGQRLEIIIDVDYLEKDKEHLKKYQEYLMKYQEKVSKYGDDSDKAEKYKEKLQQYLAEANKYGLMVSAVTVIGETAFLEREAYGQKSEDWLVKKSVSLAAGDLNAVKNSTVWSGGAAVGGSIYTQTGDWYRSELRYLSNGRGAYDSTVRSDNYIYQKAIVSVRPR